MTKDSFKLNDRFRINGAGYKKAEIWQVIAAGDSIEVVDVRDLKFPERDWAKLELRNIDYYCERGWIEMLSKPSDEEAEVTTTIADTFNECFPGITDRESDYILQEQTAFPFGDTATVCKQIKEAAATWGASVAERMLALKEFFIEIDKALADEGVTAEPSDRAVFTAGEEADVRHGFRQVTQAFRLTPPGETISYDSDIILAEGANQ
jgi:hypothetical protein